MLVFSSVLTHVWYRYTWEIYAERLMTLSRVYRWSPI